VWFLGSRADVPDLLAASDIFALSSLSEGMSNTIIEAMAASRPVVATDVGGNPELVIPDETGLLVGMRTTPAPWPTTSAGSVRDKALREAMGRAGAHRANREFSLRRMLDEYQQMYEERRRSVLTAPRSAHDRRACVLEELGAALCAPRTQHAYRQC
jgi:glycosyltransferase involved in cell wall biosynthesis